MELPQHIADMCGIVSAKTQSQLPAEEFQAVTKDIEADGIFRIAYRGELVGWIGEAKNQEPPKFRALTVNGRINHCYSASQAMSWILEEAF